MKRMLCLATALVLLGGCGARGAIQPNPSPEQAKDIVASVIDPKADVLLEVMDGVDEIEGYNNVWMEKCVGGKPIYRGMSSVKGVESFYLDKATGEPFFGFYAVSWGDLLPMRNMLFLQDGDWRVPSPENQALFEEMFSGQGGRDFIMVARRDGREYYAFAEWSALRITEDGMQEPVLDGYYLCDLATREMFSWDIETDTVNTYS